MSNDTVSRDSLMHVFPEVLRRNPKIEALAQVISDYLAGAFSDTEKCNIYANIDALPESVLDILAYDLKVDWYDYDYSIEEKRQTIKGALSVHKRIGTRYSLRTAISAIYPEIEVQEWFEYNGQPYRFRLRIDISEDEITSEKHQRVLENIKYYKNVRSIFEGAVYFMDRAETNHIYTGVAIMVMKQLDVSCAVPVLVEIYYLMDENADLLADENGNVLACDD